MAVKAVHVYTCDKKGCDYRTEGPEVSDQIYTIKAHKPGAGTTEINRNFHLCPACYNDFLNWTINDNETLKGAYGHTIIPAAEGQGQARWGGHLDVETEEQRAAREANLTDPQKDAIKRELEAGKEEKAAKQESALVETLNKQKPEERKNAIFRGGKAVMPHEF